MTKPTTHQVGRSGEHFVAGEILRRGGYASTFAGNMPQIDVLASDKEQDRTVWIQVKTRRGKWAWQSTIKLGRPRDEEDDPTRFWILVDLSGENPTYYIIPEWWMQNDIYGSHKDYLARHGGKRAKSPDSTHHAIPTTRVEQWRNRWDLLGIFGGDAS